MLGDLGADRIKTYVMDGGSYMGFCAGAYFGCGGCVFEENDNALRVVGSRPLVFYPGACVGSVAPGFEYNSERGATASTMSVNFEAFPSSRKNYETVRPFKTYLNGGGVFLKATEKRPSGVTVLASYASPISTEPTAGTAAVVHCKVYDGHAILAGPHIE